MRTKIVEGTTNYGLYLKAMVGRFEPEEWARRSVVAEQYRAGFDISLLEQEGWTDSHFVILDLSSPGGGSMFMMGGNGRIDEGRSPTRF